VLPENGPRLALLIVGKEKPITVAPGEVYRWMAPVLCRFRGGRFTGLNIRVMRGRQSQFSQTLLAALMHPVQCRQILTVLYGVLCPLENLLNGVIPQ